MPGKPRIPGNLPCKVCGGPTQVIDTFGDGLGKAINRRRRCKWNPAHRMTTVETVMDPRKSDDGWWPRREA